MRVSTTTPKPRVERDKYSTKYKILEYGDGNDYPQKIMDIVNASGTGKVCFDIYTKFIEGGGFLDKLLATKTINPSGEKANNLLRKCARDVRMFGGFALLIKYDAFLRPYCVYNIPFEHCRLEIDGNKDLTGRVVLFSDWTKRSGKAIDDKKIKRIHTYNPESVYDEILEVGGVENYIGQVLYVTSTGDFEYPISPSDPIVTDMLTEDSVATVKHRNAKFNFLPGGILVRKGIRPNVLQDGRIDPADPINQQNEESAELIRSMQGDENACKIWVVDVDADEEKPEWIPFDQKNYDRQYEYTEKTCQDNIGKLNMIPPILRGVDVGAGFASELMQQAYNFMNTVTDSERRLIEETFAPVMGEFGFNDTTIEPLKYIVT